MATTLGGVDLDRLERSCGQAQNTIRFGCGAAGIERAEARLATFAFEPHRHDTYALGVTTAGVQCFRYRGERRICLPGQIHVLHPDETHDGGPGTDDGFAYRIVYVEPEVVRGALEGAPLPFVPSPVHERTPAADGLVRLLAEMDEPLSDLGRVEAAVTIADLLGSLGRGRERDPGPIDLAAVERVRDHLAAHACEQTPAATLERIAGLDRFTLARHFRRAFGTSPDRYRTLRRLDVARSAIDGGTPLADAAAAAGFADQSHLSRQFKRAFGVTPARWSSLAGPVQPRASMSPRTIR
jgi:AraC-like DNA-binding protein